MISREILAKYLIVITGFLLPLQGISLLPGGDGLFSPLLVFSPLLLVLLVYATPYFKIEFAYIIGLLLIISASISVFWNLLVPNPTVIHSYSLEILKFTYHPKDIVRFLRVIYSIVFVIILIEAITKFNLKSFFFKSYLVGFFIGAFFGTWQLLRNIFNSIPFWSPFGTVDWALSNQIIKIGSLMVFRVNGGALEPSHWAPLCFFALFAILSLPRRGFYTICLIFIIIINLLGTFSGTMMVGFVGIGIFWLLNSIFSFKISSNVRVSTLAKFLVGLLLIGFFLAFTFKSVFVNELLFESLISKIQGQSISGVERFKILGITWNAFMQNPVVGVGVGPLVSFNTFLTILASGGVLFFVSYFFILIRCMLDVVLKKCSLEKIILFGSFFFMTTLSYGEIFSFMSWLWLFILL